MYKVKDFLLKLSQKKAAFTLAVIAFYVWSAFGVNLSIINIIEGIPNIADFISRMIPPDFSILDKMVEPTLETIQISVWGTTLAIFFSIPLGLLAAKNITPNNFWYTLSRQILNFLRATSELIFALVFVSAVGLGPFPGVLALAFHSTGMLGKFYAEAIENVDKGVIEALEATGAHKLQIIVFGIVPQISPEFLTYSLYRWEHNLRQATVLGIVGAGGLGFELITSLRLFKYRETATILIIILVTVTIMDYVNSKIRNKVIGG
ncbi:MAG: phosphonate ABC transporter, permease protein PhnE [Candidatus Methanoliparum thermophilum]|uniref:Phosphonate ABC transporter, permease protein PhnE n=1 Tax=Methanoliparum thermophilum TaxID=2491083 RepID=A0A520KRH9_METT2|nr:phosphonate ABC transporter, permease protein PhnE [Candidatus Methanoliparum sp. LAM-1]RZN64300.1 MAG: phosphonate ABC transporter, permease protein PhnE [Candidatus Methanoliparum thermophilum]BDC35558.1 phosphonate ABC transporter, permease protein PhnE [Candidatus Methanoliparum sp. LAM-1]